MFIKTESSLETLELGYRIGSLLKDSKNSIILLDGSLGAGKTTFAKGVAKALDISKPVNSPTFTILKEYISDDKENKFHHIDLYRLSNVGEDFDLEEYIDDSTITVIEWPFQVVDLLPDEYLLIKIKRAIVENHREFELIPVGKKYEDTIRKL